MFMINEYDKYNWIDVFTGIGLISFKLMTPG